MTVVVETRGAHETELLAELLAARLKGGETLLLSGELGAGKTCFVRGLAAGLGLDPTRVKSPSYNILRSHTGGRLVLDHFDAYFVREGGEFERTGIAEFLQDGHVVAVEWADRFPEVFAADAVKIHMEHVEEEVRRATMTRAGRWESPLTGLDELFLRRRGRDGASGGRPATRG